MMSLVVLSAIVVAGGEFQLVASDYNLLKGYGTKL